MKSEKTEYTASLTLTTREAVMLYNMLSDVWNEYYVRLWRDNRISKIRSNRITDLTNKIHNFLTDNYIKVND